MKITVGNVILLEMVAICYRYTVGNVKYLLELTLGNGFVGYLLRQICK